MKARAFPGPGEPANGGRQPAAPRAPWLAGLLLAACATVPPGHAAVVTNPNSGISADPLTEGVWWVNPWAQVDLFDLRAQERNEDLKGVAADGAPMQANASVVTYHIVPSELPQFDREVGPEPYDNIIRPVVQAAVRRVVARYTAFECEDTRNIPTIQAAVTALAARQLRPLHIQVDGVYLRSLTATSERLNREIVDTSRAEQRMLTMPHEIEITRARAEALREQGRAAASANDIVRPTLSPQTLADESRRAWTRLLTSPSTSVAVGAEGSPSLEVAP